MDRRRWALFALVAGVACASTHESGQTGSAECALPPSCPCDVLGGAVLLEASVVEVSEQNVTVEVIRALSVPTDGAAGAAGQVGAGEPVHAGDVLSGSTSWACGGLGSTLAPGAHVLVADAPGRALWLTTWRDKYGVGGEAIGLSIDELEALTDAEACTSRYPPSHAGPCNDTPSYSTGTTSCAMARAGR